MSRIFISFIGTDGSGKSTLATKVFHRIREKDKRIKKIYGRYTPIAVKLAMALGRGLLFKENKDMFSDYDNYLKSKKSLFRKASMLSQIYIGMMIIEYFLELIFKIVIPYKLGYSIITDRYVYDTIINDIAIDMELSPTDTIKLLGKFWFLIPRPDITFLVKVPEDVAIKRKNDIPSLSYLKIRNNYYSELVGSEHIVVLDGTLKISELEEKVFYEMSKNRT